MRITLGRKYYTLRYVPALGPGHNGYDGDCSPPDETGRVIRIRKGQTPREELETLIHEMQHALQWPLSEEFVTEASRDIARVLWRLGWRKGEAT